ncbi:MAG: amino acid adenylation domain-containing protein [Gemmatimonadota bacterium]|nr:amino acid adenylation domain-containing protein [Gemmatimonadota bacterium]
MVKGNIEAAFPLTPLQEGMLYHSLRDPTSGFYHGQVSFRLEALIQPDLMRQAFQRTVDRHESLRTFFAWERRDRPLQVVRGRVELPWLYLDWRSENAAVHRQRWTDLLRDDASRPFELSSAPLSRVALVRLGEASYRVLWSVHHAVSDGWSGSLIVREVLEDYAALASGVPLPERPTPPSFARFVGWIESRDKEAEERYWRRQLESFHAPTALPFSVGSVTRTAGLTKTLHLAVDQYDRIRRAAAKMRVTPATVVAGGWAILLGRYEESREVVFGSTVSERPAEIPGVQSATGLYLNTVPVRAKIEAHASPAEFLQALQRTMSEGRAHGSAGLSRIAGWSGLEPAIPLFRTVVVFESFPQDLANSEDPAGPTPSHVSIDGPSDLPLGLVAIPGEGLTLELKHDPGLYDDVAADRLLAQVESILDELTKPSSERLGTISCLPPAHREVVTRTWSHGPDPSRPPEDCVALFEQIVDRQPDSTAVKSDGKEMRYRELEEAANRVAHELVRRGIGPGSLVAVPAGRNVETIVAFLSVLKAGGGYAPMDPGLPAVRRDPLLEGFDLVLRPTASDWSDLDQPVVDLFNPIDGPSHRLARPVDPGTPAYVIFTSGSTGRPKGVVVSRANLAHSLQARFDTYPKNPESFLLLSPLWVDSSVAGLYWTLCTGGALSIPQPGEEQDLRAVAETIQAHGVSHTLLVPSLYDALLDDDELKLSPPLTTVIVAGESASSELIARHTRRLPEVSLFNEYGPSEATVWATVADLSHELHGPVTIGRPIPAYRVYVLDESLRPTGIGMAGEIVIGGPAVANGYLGDPEQTRARFVPDPVAGEGLVYHTGDRGRWLDDGRLQFLGRVDNQLKIRGFRVEVEEIEATLSAHPQVREAAVYGDLRPGAAVALRACLVSEGVAPRHSELDRWLADRIPRYMVPDGYLLVDTLPRTAAGKLDRGSLQTLHGHPLGDTRGPILPPRNPAEAQLAEIWQSVLGLDRVGVHEDFFELGGDSLSSIRVLSQASRAGFDIDPESFFRAPTIAALAAVVTRDTGAESTSDVDEAPLTPIQRWFFHTVTDDPDHWNQDRTLEFEPGVLSANDARRILTLLMEHHAALRTRFVCHPEGDPIRQRVAPMGHAPLRTVRPHSTERSAQEHAFLSACAEAHRSLKLDQGRVFQAVALEQDGCVRLLALVSHHLVIDAVSWNILLDDLASLIQQCRDGRPLALPPRTETFMAWAQRLEGHAHALDGYELLQATESLPPGPSPCSRRGMTAGRTADQVEEIIRLEPSVLSALDAARRRLEASMEELLITGFMIGWHAWSGDELLCMDLEGHGRDQADHGQRVHRTVGWFTTVAPFRCRLGATHRDTLRRVQRAIGRARGSGFDQNLLRYLSPVSEVREGLAARITSDVLFNYMGLATKKLQDAPYSPRPPLSGLARSPRAQRGHVLEVNTYQTAAGLEMCLVGGPGSATELPELASGLREALIALTRLEAARFEIEDFADADYDTVYWLLQRLDVSET